MSPIQPTENRRPVWDRFVRFFHWTLVGCVLLNSFVVDDGEDLHQWLGYLAAALVTARFVWGFIGSRHARFSDFFPTPQRVVRHVHGLLARRPEFHWGHNPLGRGDLVLMAAVIALGVTGWMQSLDAFCGEEWLQDLHEALGEGLLMAAGLHAASAIVMGRIERTRLVKAMVTGTKERY
jgi:cytochrome b